MLKITILLAAVSCVFGCQQGSRDWGNAAPEETDDPPDITVEKPAHCNGICVDTAPATFTGPSIFWFGTPDLTPQCPEETPNQGIQGFVDTPSQWFTRECLITPSDLCPTEGETCVPFPPDSYALCIHHPSDVDCTPTYFDRRPMHDAETQLDVTLCCTTTKMN